MMAVLLAACGERRPPNILLVSIDSLRADHVGCYGYERDTTPTMDRLAAEGVRFETALAPTSWTLPSHVTMFTGIPPHHHHVTLDNRQLAADVKTLAEVLSGEGYRTGAIVSGPYVSARYGIAQGFDDYDESIIPALGETHTTVVAPKLEAAVKGWIDAWREEPGEQPFFLFLHMWDVHYDFNPPAPYDRMFDPGYSGSFSGKRFIESGEVNPNMDPRDLEFILAQYDGEIRYTDEHLGRIIDYLDELDNTIVVVTADHGEEFFEHGHKGHRRSLYDEVLLVPLIIRYPARIPAGTVVEAQARLMDIGSTILSLAGVSQPRDYGIDATHEHLRPKDLTRRIRGEEGLSPNLAFGDFEYYLLTVRTRDTKLLMSPKDFFYPKLFDLTKDPEKLHDIAAERPEATAELLEAARHFRRGDTVRRDRPAKIDREQLERLKALGYIQ